MFPGWILMVYPGTDTAIGSDLRPELRARLLEATYNVGCLEIGRCSGPAGPAIIVRVAAQISQGCSIMVFQCRAGLTPLIRNIWTGFMAVSNRVHTPRAILRLCKVRFGSLPLKTDVEQMQPRAQGSSCIPAVSCYYELAICRRGSCCCCGRNGGVSNAMVTVAPLTSESVRHLELLSVVERRSSFLLSVCVHCQFSLSVLNRAVLPSILYSRSALCQTVFTP